MKIVSQQTSKRTIVFAHKVVVCEIINLIETVDNLAFINLFVSSLARFKNALAYQINTETKIPYASDKGTLLQK